MKKIKLPQPYASMVIAGALTTLPNIWSDTKYGEKIFIYADDFDEDFLGDFDHTKPMHRKIYNETFLGNIPDDVENFPIKKFIGICKGQSYRHNAGRLEPKW